MTAILFLYWKGREDAFGHPYIFSAFAFIVSVAIVFRCASVQAPNLGSEGPTMKIQRQ